MPHRLTTDAVPPRERLSYWIDSVCAIYVHLDCDTPLERQGFSGEIAHATLGPLACSRVASLAQRVSRTPAQIARTTDPWTLVSIQTEGEGWVRQDGREARLRPGDCALYDSTRPYELLFRGPFAQTVLKIPSARLADGLAGVDGLTATTIAGERGTGRLFSTMAATLMGDVDAIDGSAGEAVAQGTIDLLVAALQSLPAARRNAVTDIAALHRARARSFVRDHLSDPALSAGAVARAIGLSESTLHRAFRDEPMTLMQWLWRERLDAIRRDLANPANVRRTATDIAFARGFNDASHFSRAFKARFGHTPSAFRRRPSD